MDCFVTTSTVCCQHIQVKPPKKLKGAAFSCGFSHLKGIQQLTAFKTAKSAQLRNPSCVTRLLFFTIPTSLLRPALQYVLTGPRRLCSSLLQHNSYLSGQFLTKSPGIGQTLLLVMSPEVVSVERLTRSGRHTILLHIDVLTTQGYWEGHKLLATTGQHVFQD